MNKLFVSYARKDRDFATKLCDGLIAKDFSVWYDKSFSDRTDKEWEDIIQQSIGSAAIILVLVTKNFSISEVARREFQYAERLNKPIINVLLQNADLPSIDCFDFVDFSKSWDAGFDVLVEKLEWKLTSRFSAMRSNIWDYALKGQQQVLHKPDNKLIAEADRLLNVNPSTEDENKLLLKNFIDKEPTHIEQDIFDVVSHYLNDQSTDREGIWKDLLIGLEIESYDADFDDLELTNGFREYSIDYHIAVFVEAYKQLWRKLLNKHEMISVALAGLEYEQTGYSYLAERNISHNPELKFLYLRSSTLKESNILRDYFDIEHLPNSTLPEAIEWRMIAGFQDGQLNHSRLTSILFMSAYPITQAQYRKFIDAPDGYRNRLWWEKVNNNSVQGASNLLTEDNYLAYERMPQTCINWYEAVAFCRWLTANMHSSGQWTGEVRLPTEHEWQRAAEGLDERRYPLEDTFDVNNCNVLESKYHQTTPVHQHPKGKSPYGVQDMTGNNWEWCLDASDDTKIQWHQSLQDGIDLARSQSVQANQNLQKRVIRGSLSINQARNKIVADRMLLPATTARRDIGFRIMCTLSLKQIR